MLSVRSSPKVVPAQSALVVGTARDIRRAWRWEDALNAASLLAGASDSDLAAIRRFRTIAVGAAEAGGARYLGAVQLRLLAAAELAAGDHSLDLARQTPTSARATASVSAFRERSLRTGPARAPARRG